MAAKENFTVTWNEKDEIKLTHDAVVIRRHQNTGDEVRKNEMWHSSVPTRLLLMIFCTSL